MFFHGPRHRKFLHQATVDLLYFGPQLNEKCVIRKEDGVGFGLNVVEDTYQRIWKGVFRGFAFTPLEQVEDQRNDGRDDEKNLKTCEAQKRGWRT